MPHVSFPAARVAHYYWPGPDFSLMDLASVLSTAQHTSFEQIQVYYDEDGSPQGAAWESLPSIIRVQMLPTRDLLQSYLEQYLGRDLVSFTDRRVKADLFRYAHLHAQGGTWFDFNTLQIRDVCDLAEEREFLAGSECDNWESTPLKDRRRVNSFIRTVDAPSTGNPSSRSRPPWAAGSGKPPGTSSDTRTPAWST